MNNAIDLNIAELISHYKALISHSDVIVELPKCNENDRRGVAIWLLFIFILRQAKAINVLLINRMADVAEVLIRPTIEALFYMGAAVNDEECARKYWGISYFIDRENLRAIFKNPNLNTHFNKTEIDELRETLVSIESFIKKNDLGTKKVSAIEFASEANLKSLYAAYRKYCNAIHVCPKHLGSNYLRTNGQSIEQINLDFNSKETEKDIILTTNLILALSCNRLRSAFDIRENPVNEIERYYIENRPDR